VNGFYEISFIDRFNQTSNENPIPNLSKKFEYLSLKPFPNFDYIAFPYVLIKDT